MTAEDQPQPVFVVGMNGSGTTMLLDCLDNHPDLFGFRRETRVIPYFIGKLDSYGELAVDENFARLWDDFRSIPDFVQVNGGEPPPKPREWRSAPRTFAAVVDGTFMYFAGQAGKARWCEKTPMHALHIGKLAILFPGAKFLHIIRDGRSCAASFHRRWGHTPEFTVYRWKNVVREARRQGGAIDDRYFELRYEDLVQDAEFWMKKICIFLGVPYNESVLLPSRKRPVTTGSADLQIVAKAPVWQSYFSARRLRRLEGICGLELTRHRYEPQFTAGDRDPGPMRRKYWLYADYLRLGLSDLRGVLAGKSAMSLKDLYGKVKGSIQQRVTTKY